MAGIQRRTRGKSSERNTGREEEFIMGGGGQEPQRGMKTHREEEE